MINDYTFDNILPRSVELVQRVFPGVELGACRFVRDMNGHLFVVVPDNIDEKSLEAASSELANVLGAYSPSLDGGLVRFKDTLSGLALHDEPVLVHDINGSLVRVIERSVVGQDWAQAPMQADGGPPRVAFFSLKGGVGRSTALFLLGRHLAAQGRTLLLIDLDMEAPGLGAQLLSEGAHPEFGVLDWLVEDLVKNPLAEHMAERMVARTSWSECPGLHIAPAVGYATDQHPSGFISKLARAYLGTNEARGEEGFAARARRLCKALEAHVRPDVVLIDSRAGLHETAAAAVLHLDADVLLFSTDQPMAWKGYRYLLARLGLMAETFAGEYDDDWRLKFKMVHAKAGETQWELDRYLENSYQLWVDSLYDETPPGSDKDWFTFSIKDEAAPHYPLTILRDSLFERFNPLEHLPKVVETAITTAFGDFARELEQRIFGEIDAN